MQLVVTLFYQLVWFYILFYCCELLLPTAYFLFATCDQNCLKEDLIANSPLKKSEQVCREIKIRHICPARISGSCKMQDQLIIRLHNQDRTAIGDLYDAYGAALFGVVLRIVQSRELAEQVLQDTFVKAWRHGASYDHSKGRLFTWLLNIARNTAIDATRTAYYQHYRKTESIENIVHTPGPDNIRPDLMGVREIVEQLDDKYKLLIELIYFKGYTQEEVAEETGIPLGTVKTRVRYAIGELRKVFGDRSPAVALLIAVLLK